jgi:outer membrane protein assembly factor BamB
MCMKKIREIFFLLIAIVLMICSIGSAAADEPTGPTSDNVRMHITTDGGIDSTSAVHDNRLFIANWKSMDFSTTNAMGVFCFDLTNGDLIWFRSIGEVLSEITVADGQVFAGTKSGALFCLDEETGNTVWSVTGITAGYWGLTGAPLVNDGVVYVTSPTKHQLTGYDTGNGNLVFQRGLGSSGGIIFTSPTLSSSNNLLVMDDTRILEISPANDLVNSYTLPSAITTGSSIVAHGDAVYLNANGILYRINTIGEWTEAWNVSTLTSTTPVVTDSAVYVSQAGTLAAYDITSGEALDGFTTHVSGGSSSYLNPVLAGNTIYYAMNAHCGKVFAINATTGAEEWNFSLPESGNPGEDYTFFASSPVVCGENLFIGSEGAGFYVIGEGDLIEIDKTNAADQPYVPPAPMTVIYEGTVRLMNTSDGVTVKDALDAAVSAGGFTYNLTEYDTIKDINGIENAEDWSHSWMTTYYNNNEIPVYSVLDPVVAGATISLHYDELDASWNVVGTQYLVNVTVGNIDEPAPWTVIYDDTVNLTNSSTGVTVKDALDAAVSAGGFTYNLTEYDTIKDINGIENAEDWSHSWMTTYYNNNEIPVYSVLDPVVTGATISLHYDELDASWNVVGTQYLVNVTVGNIDEPDPWTVIYDDTVNLTNSSDGVTVKDALDAAVSAGGFTYNLTEYDTIKDINGIENAEDWSHSWMTTYYNNNEIPVFSVLDPVVAGATISLHYDELDASWNVIGTEYMVNVTVNSISDLSITYPSTMVTGSSAVFTALANYPGNTTYSWDFGDNTSVVETKSSGVASAVDKIYTNAGTKIISVTAEYDNRSVTNSAEIIVTTPPSAFDESSSLEANLTGESISDIAHIFFTGTDVTDAANITISISRYQNQSSISDHDWLDIQTNYTIPNTNEKPLFILEIDSSNADGINNIHQLNNYARLTIRLAIDYANASNVSFYRYADGSNGYEQLHYTIGNVAPGWVEFLVDIPGFSTIIAVSDEIPANARTTAVSPPGTQINQIIPQYKTIYYGTITVDPGSFTYTTTMDDKTFIVNNLSVFGILHASGMNLQTKEWPGGIYVHSINGIAQDENLNGWLYQVNGMTTSQLSNNYMVHDGDKIVWYYSESMSSLPETSQYAYGFTVKVRTSAVPLLNLSAAETPTVNLGMPEGVTISSGIPQRITIDTSITQAGGFVNITEHAIIITTPGLQMTIPVKNLIRSDEIVTAEIQNMTAELVPAAGKIKTSGIEV